MSLGNYLNILLRKHDVVIVPGLGAFYSGYKAAQIDDTTDEVTPPSKEILFDPKIKNNDGLLAEEIARNKNISDKEALIEIYNTIDDLIYKLDKEGKVDLENIGLLYYDVNNEIQLEPFPEGNLLLDAFGLGTISLKDDISHIPEEKSNIDNSRKSLSADDLHNSGDFNDEVEIHESDNSENSVDPLETNLADKEAGNTTENKKRRWLWLLIPFILVTAAGIFLVVKPGKKNVLPDSEISVQPPVSEKQPEEKQIARDDILPAADTSATDSVEIPVADSVETNKQKFDSTEYISPDPTKFYLVGGSFIEYENAQKYYRQMKENGYEPFHLGKQGSFYIVGLAVFDNEIEAYGAQYDFLDKYPDSGVWVFIPE